MLSDRDSDNRPRSTHSERRRSTPPDLPGASAFPRKRSDPSRARELNDRRRRLFRGSDHDHMQARADASTRPDLQDRRGFHAVDGDQTAGRYRPAHRDEQRRRSPSEGRRGYSERDRSVILARPARRRCRGPGDSIPCGRACRVLGIARSVEAEMIVHHQCFVVHRGRAWSGIAGSLDDAIDDEVSPIFRLRGARYSGYRCSRAPNARHRATRPAKASPSRRSLFCEHGAIARSS